MKGGTPAIVTVLLATMAAGMVAAGCGTPLSRADARPTELTVYAAASLKETLQEISAAYATAAPGVRLTVSTAASTALRAQIEQGAPADVFLSADTTQPAALVDAGLVAGETLVFAGNRLAIIVPAADPAGIDTPADLARPGIGIVAAGEAVPITRYASELIDRLAGLEGYPAGYAEAVTANVVSREDDVKIVVAKIELGEGDAAIVYQTDALASEGVSTVDIPAEANVVASYAGMVVKASVHPVEARAFLDWLVTDPAQSIFAPHGFAPPAPAP